MNELITLILLILILGLLVYTRPSLDRTKFNQIVLYFWWRGKRYEIILY